MLPPPPAPPKSFTQSGGYAAVSPGLTLHDHEFNLLRQLFRNDIGLNLSDEKKALVTGRLSRRIQQVGLTSFRQYYDHICSPAQADERQIAIDLITTNETFFFREPKQFYHLRDNVLPAFPRNQLFRLWCAASSTGEEPYSLAMLLDATRGQAPWTMMASDISTRALATAQRGLYQMVRTEGIPPDYLKRYCRKGQGQYDNHLLIDRALRERVAYQQVNLTKLPPNLGMFEAIFIRNVIIYFDAPTRAEVIRNVLHHLVPGGLLCLGHSESMQGVSLPIEQIAPSTYRKVG